MSAIWGLIFVFFMIKNGEQFRLTNETNFIGGIENWAQSHMCTAILMKKNRIVTQGWCLSTAVGPEPYHFYPLYHEFNNTNLSDKRYFRYQPLNSTRDNTTLYAVNQIVLVDAEGKRFNGTGIPTLAVAQAWGTVNSSLLGLTRKEIYEYLSTKPDGCHIAGYLSSGKRVVLLKVPVRPSFSKSSLYVKTNSYGVPPGGGLVCPKNGEDVLIGIHINSTPPTHEFMTADVVRDIIEYGPYSKSPFTYSQSLFTVILSALSYSFSQ